MHHSTVYHQKGKNAHLILSGAEREQESDFFLVLDEIGKMELLSSKFSSGVQQLFDKDHQRIICTIPVSSAGRQNKILEKIRARRDARLFEVNCSLSLMETGVQKHPFLCRLPRKTEMSWWML